jgi:GNAT superfamily N-acetyltransferase
VTRFKLSGLKLTGYFPGVIGKITQEHAIYYYENWGFDISFETQVGIELSEFLTRFQENRDGFWVATLEGKFAGAIAIDRNQESNEEARLRWFIVTPGFQGKGIGKALLRKSIEFCKKAGYKRVYLWTFKGLEPARYLYEREGFTLRESHEVKQWGQEIIEQMFELYL